MLVYIFYNSRVVNRLHSPAAQGDWESLARWMAIPLTDEQHTAMTYGAADQQVIISDNSSNCKEEEEEEDEEEDEG